MLRGRRHRALKTSCSKGLRLTGRSRWVAPDVSSGSHLRPNVASINHRTINQKTSPGGRGECIGTSAPAEHGSPELAWGGTLPGTCAAFCSFSTRNSCSKPSCLPQNVPCDSCLLPRALLDSLSVLSVYLTEQPSGRARWRRCVGAGQRRGVLVARVSSAGEHGQAVSPGAACGRANFSADTVSSWLFAIGTGGRRCGTGTAVGDGGRGFGWTVRVRMDIVAK